MSFCSDSGVIVFHHGSYCLKLHFSSVSCPLPGQALRFRSLPCPVSCSVPSGFCSFLSRSPFASWPSITDFPAAFHPPLPSLLRSITIFPPLPLPSSLFPNAHTPFRTHFIRPYSSLLRSIAAFPAAPLPSSLFPNAHIPFRTPPFAPTPLYSAQSPPSRPLPLSFDVEYPYFYSYFRFFG